MRLSALLLCALSLSAQSSIQTLIDDGHLKRAAAAAESRFAANPNDPEAQYYMAWVKQAKGDPAAAQQLAEKAVAADPKNARYHFRLAEALGEQAQKAGALKQVGLGRHFKKEIDATLALDPKHVEALNDLMLFYLQAPGILGGDKTKAHAIPAQIRAVDPVKGYFADVALAQHDKQTEHVEELYRKAVEARPNDYNAVSALATWCVNNKKAPEAETRAREALKLNPGRTNAYIVLAAALAMQDRWNDVDPVLAQAEKEIPDNWVPYFRLANYCLGRGVELPRAERYLRKYLSQDPELGNPTHAAAHWRLGLVFQKQGRKPDAVAEFQTAVKMDPNSPAKEELKKK